MQRQMQRQMQRLVIKALVVHTAKTYGQHTAKTCGQHTAKTYGQHTAKTCGQHTAKTYGQHTAHQETHIFAHQETHRWINGRGEVTTTAYLSTTTAPLMCPTSRSRPPHCPLLVPILCHFDSRCIDSRCIDSRCIDSRSIDSRCIDSRCSNSLVLQLPCVQLPCVLRGMSCYLGQSRHLCATTLPLYRRARSGVLFSLEISAALGLFAAAGAMTARQMIRHTLPQKSQMPAKDATRTFKLELVGRQVLGPTRLTACVLYHMCVLLVCLPAVLVIENYWKLRMLAKRKQ